MDENNENNDGIKENHWQILLKEYEMCQSNRDHYDKLVWQIGSIFIAICLAALWIGIEIEIFYYRYPLAVFSVSVSVLWLLMSRRSQAFSRLSLDRAREIEAELGMQLHRNIDKADSEKRLPRIKAKYCMWFFIIVVLVAWILLLSFPYFIELSKSN